MDIVFLTTFPPQSCGIGEYAYDLACALRKRGHKITVLAEQTRPMGAEREDYDGIPTYRVWNRQAAFETALGLRAVASILASSAKRPDVIHIQHEFGLFPTTVLNRFYQALADKGLKYLLTAHTVLPGPLQTEFFLNPHKPKHFIAHTAMQAAVLYKRSGTLPHVIPHGCPPPVATPAPDADLPFILSPGFLSPSKNHEEIIRGFAAFKGAARSNARLIIAGEPRVEGYLEKLEDWTRVYGVEDCTEIQDRYHSRTELHALVGRATCVLLGGHSGPNQVPSYSASGQLSYAISFGKPVLAKNIPIYQDGASVLWNTHEELATALGGIIGNKQLQGFLAARGRALAAERTWDKVAEAHEAVYQLYL